MKKSKKVKPQNKKVKDSTGGSGNTKYLWLAFAVIAIVTFFLYAPGLNGEFVIDDDLYITNNPGVQNGDILSFFNQFYADNYQPFLLTLYSFIFHFSGLEPHGYHLASLLFHVVNCGLVLWFMFLLTESSFISIVVSLLFAIHPMHVESVAWASELKDVIYAAGFLLALIQYTLYLKTGKRKFYYLTILFFIISFLFKGQAIALVLVLPLLDYFVKNKITILNKIPFALMAGGLAVVIYVAVVHTRNLGVHYPLSDRLLFSSFAYITYIWKLFVPVNLSAMYPYPEKTATLYVYPVLCAALFAFCVWFRTNKKIVFGIGFFTFTILMMLMIISVGAFLICERYTYVSSIGIFYLMAAGILFLYQKNPYYATPFVLLLLFYFYQSTQRIKVWQNKESLYTDVLNQFPNQSLARFQRANYYLDVNKPALALADAKTEMYYKVKGDYCSEAVETINEKIATCYFRMDSFPQALYYYTKAIDSTTTSSQLYPMLGTVYWNRASTYYKLNQMPEMIVNLKKAAEHGHEGAKEIVQKNGW